MKMKNNMCVCACVQSKTGELEGPEVDGFVKDMMELVKVITVSLPLHQIPHTQRLGRILTGWPLTSLLNPFPQPSISGTDLDKFRKALMGHCDINGDGKIQKNELALCLGLKLSWRSRTAFKTTLLSFLDRYSRSASFSFYLSSLRCIFAILMYVYIIPHWLCLVFRGLCIHLCMILDESKTIIYTILCTKNSSQLVFSWLHDMLLCNEVKYLTVFGSDSCGTNNMNVC